MLFRAVIVFAMNFLQMFLQDTLGRILLLATLVCTLIRFVSGVNTQMSFQDTFLIERFQTAQHWAFENFFTSLKIND
jgi:hypothetical protein